jgi:hypothetical protein
LCLLGKQARKNSFYLDLVRRSRVQDLANGHCTEEFSTFAVDGQPAKLFFEGRPAWKATGAVDSALPRRLIGSEAVGGTETILEDEQFQELDFFSSFLPKLNISLIFSSSSTDSDSKGGIIKAGKWIHLLVL